MRKSPILSLWESKRSTTTSMLRGKCWLALMGCAQATYASELKVDDGSGNRSEGGRWRPAGGQSEIAPAL